MVFVIILLQVNDPLDSLIAAAIVLFILSTITEKLTQLVRMYPNQFRIIGLGFSSIFLISIIRGIFFEPSLERISWIILLVFDVFLLIMILANTINESKVKSGFKRILSKNLSVLQNVGKNNDNVSEEVKEREVTALSFILGLIVAFLFDANIFELFKSGVPPDLRTGSPFFNGSIFILDPTFFRFSFSAAVGYALTAFFLAFGSKFFHDILDNLLQVKNLRRKLNNKETYDIDKIEQFDEYIKITEFEILKQAIQEHSYLKSKSNVISVLRGARIVNGVKQACVVIHLKDKDRTGIPSILTVTLPSSRIVTVPVDVIENVDIPKIQIQTGDSLNNAVYADYKGTLGCTLNGVDGYKYFLTCNHVLTNGLGINPGGYFENGDLVYSRSKLIGQWIFGIRDNQLDIALIKARNDVLSQIRQSDFNSWSRELNDNDHLKPIFFKGAVSGNQDGFIAHISAEYPVEYNDGVPQMEKLIILANQLNVSKSYRISEGGDSGSVVYDENNYAIGVILAGNTQFSFAMPMEAILKRLESQYTIY